MPFSLLVFIFGLGVGSFINVVVYRLNLISDSIPDRKNRRSGIVSGRSFCPKCKKKIAWYDNLPLLSFAILRGKCRHCQKPISWQYPLVELATGFLFVGVYEWVKEWCGIGSIDCYIAILLYCYIGVILVAIFTSDLLYETIPDEITYPAIVVAFLYQIALSFLFTSEVKSAGTPEVDATRLLSIFGSQNPVILFRQILVSHFGVFLLAGLGAAGFFLMLHLVTKGRGMGMGDVKLAGLMGLVLGYPEIVVALLLAFLTGALVGVILILLGRKQFGQHLAFGPFLASATWIALFWGEKIADFYFFLLGI